MNAKRELKLQTLLSFDALYFKQYSRFAGIDEAGRGPLAGPVVAACVIMPRDPVIQWVDDSKALSEFRREKVYENIMSSALFVGIGSVDANEIDSINILQATMKAMCLAAKDAMAELYLVDAVKGLQLAGRQEPLIRGDALSYSIAAASIIAKVSRDREMRLMGDLYPQYGFKQNKGYGTAGHIRALREFGPCPLHRKSFIHSFVPASI